VYKDMEVTDVLDFFRRALLQSPTVAAVKNVKRHAAALLEAGRLSEKKVRVNRALIRGGSNALACGACFSRSFKCCFWTEPASGLDPRARIEMMAILQELQRLGKLLIISSHIFYRVADCVHSRLPLSKKAG